MSKNAQTTQRAYMQKSIPYRYCYEEGGMIETEPGVFTRTYEVTLPWNHRGWHCGSGSRGSGNNTHIGVEMCEPACIRYTAG